jgi:methylated-DNA-[protein]-cysteine S-methyltransferase
MNLQTETTSSPIGDILLVFDTDTLRALDFQDHENRTHHFLRLYYGKVTLSPGKSPITRKVWQSLTAIKPGKTKTYSEIASEIGHPRAVRAVGAANGANPISLANPCHRVIGANGTLTGYGGGLHRKKWLLNHELTHV